MLFPYDDLDDIGSLQELHLQHFRDYNTVIYSNQAADVFMRPRPRLIGKSFYINSVRPSVCTYIHLLQWLDACVLITCQLSIITFRQHSAASAVALQLLLVMIV